MPWVNYHSHSNFCDGNSEPEQYIQEAINKGFYAYGCSSHAPVSFPSHWNMRGERLQEYLDHLVQLKSKYKNQIQLYTGLEIDYIEGKEDVLGTYVKDLPLDYRIGSVHYLDPLSDGSYFCFDGKPDGFFRQIHVLYGNNFKKVIRKYYHLVRQMVQYDVPDIIGHLDKIKMHNSVQRYFDENEDWYIREVEQTLDIIAEKNCIIEVNTRGLYRHDPPLLYPGKWILERIYEKNIPVMINSDAHDPSEIDAGYDFAASLLLDIGWKTVRILFNGKWCDVPFGKEGLMI